MVSPLHSIDRFYIKKIPHLRIYGLLIAVGIGMLFGLLPITRANAQATSTPIAAPAYCSADVGNAMTAMKQYDLITLGNLSTSSDVEGRTFVGNSFTGANSANFAN